MGLVGESPTSPEPSGGSGTYSAQLVVFRNSLLSEPDVERAY